MGEGGRNCPASSGYLSPSVGGDRSRSDATGFLGVKGNREIQSSDSRMP